MRPSLFERVCDALEERSELDRLEARGTVRIALRAAGLDPRCLTSHQMSVVLAELLPRELQVRGVSDAITVCQALGAIVELHGDDEAVDAGNRIDGLFRRTL